jgi:hypothetical protein
MGKSIEIACGPTVQEILITALRNYTDVAFPEHSSDCAQVARSAMIDAVDQLEQQLSASDKGEYNKRLRAMFKEGIKLHYEIAATETGSSYAHEQALLISVCQGDPADDEALVNARHKDGRGN